MFSVGYVVLVEHPCECVQVFTARTPDEAWSLGRGACPEGFGGKFYILNRYGRTIVAPAGSVVGKL